MTRKHYIQLFSTLLAGLFLLASCAVVDDLPLPLVKAEVTAFIVDGQCDADGEGFADAVIDKEKRTVDVYVNDLVQLDRLNINTLQVSHSASISVETPQGLVPISKFADSNSGKPVLDFTSPVTIVLSTYQDYRWTLRVQQVVKREVVLQNQVGRAVIDPVNCNVVAYVLAEQDLRKVLVEKFTLGGPHGTVEPDPTGQEVDFSLRREFTVHTKVSDAVEQWNVFVYHADATATVSASVFPHATKAYVKGQMQNGSTPVVEYRSKSNQEWSTLPGSQVEAGSVEYKAVITGLLPGTEYECRVKAGGQTSAVQTFRTAEALQIPNASFDDWSISGNGLQALYQPWGEGSEPYWDTGNKGATTVGASNSTFGTEDGRVYANLQSKFIVIKFAAGNIFNGSYLKTDGTNGILAFGRPFESFPTKMQFDYKFKSSIVNRGGGKWDENYGKYLTRELYEGLRGKPDSCQIYVALIGDQDEEQYNGNTYPIILRTRPSELKLFNPRSDNVIAYAQLTQGDNVEKWTTETLTLDYRHTDRTPKYIVIVASSSKYGDYFIGGDETLLQLDNIRLLYE